MKHFTQSGGVEAEGSIQAGTINTGHIEQTTNLSITVILDNLAQLTTLLQHPAAAIKHATDQPTEIKAEGEEPLSLPENLLAAFKALPRAIDQPTEIRQRAYAAWLVTRRPDRPIQLQAAREHYVPLAGRLSLLELSFSERRRIGEGPQQQWERIPLPDVREAVSTHPAFVLLGPPGAGKSTVLRRLSLDTARTFLTGEQPRLPLAVNLAQYQTHETPLQFVSQQWRLEGLLGDFVTACRAGGVLLLADGLNEMARLDSEGATRRRANDWQRFAEQYFGDPQQGSRLVIASRDQADYSQPLGLPRVDIDPLDAAQIEQFLQAYLGERAADALEALHRLDLFAHAGNPYQLFVLADMYDPATGDLPPNRGQLFEAYARRLITREEQAGHANWVQTDALLAAVAVLGYAMQQQGESTVFSAEAIEGQIPAQVMLPGRRQPVITPPTDVFDLACRAGLLSPTGGGATAYKFSHQLLQEQFAAQHLLTRWTAGESLADLWSTPRTHRQVPRPTGDTWDPLPPPPATGWEQTTILAAGITDAPSEFVRAVRGSNPALAGRCLTEGQASVDAATRRDIQAALLADLRDPALHRRTRIQAGRVLGAVGDPRFEPVNIRGVAVVLPEWVKVPGGTATLGRRRWPWSWWGEDDEQPPHQVEVATCYLGRYPVTNAEYRCFIEAGGYDEASYWTAEGWQWRQGQSESSGPVEEILGIYRHLSQNPGEIDKWFREGRITPDTAKRWRQLIQMSEGEIRQQAQAAYPNQPHEQPYFWEDPAYNGLNQPVVGVTWYEAVAYCHWLGAQLKQEGEPVLPGEPAVARLLQDKGWVVRLPTEAEWEWAAGGPGHRQYPWGWRFAADRANTLEGRVLTTSPVGAYPGGRAVCGAEEMSGTVYEWTLSEYQPYPYLDDERNHLKGQNRRSMRGGGWPIIQRYARVSYRNYVLPNYFYGIDGFRVVLALSKSS